MTPVFCQPELLQQTLLQYAEIFDTIGSTQDRALELCADPSLTVPALVVAQRQTAGHGRDGASWWSPDGALLFSLIMPLPQKFAQAHSSGQLSLAIAQAVADYLRVALRPSGSDKLVHVKPPNDIYIANAKIAGLLIDVPHQSNRKQRIAVVGIGLNVNNDGRNSPAEITVPVTSTSELTGKKHNLQETLISLLCYLEKTLMTHDA